MILTPQISADPLPSGYTSRPRGVGVKTADGVVVIGPEPRGSAMTDLELMLLSIREAKKCSIPEAERNDVPRVGEVIAINGIPIARSPRVGGDHAEMLALETLRGQDLTKATVFTTLEPCTPGVRSMPGGSCTDRLIQSQVKKVVIGMVDPNREICGKSMLALYSARRLLWSYFHTVWCSEYAGSTRISSGLSSTFADSSPRCRARSPIERTLP